MHIKVELRLTENNPGNKEMLPFHYFDIIREDTIIGKISLRFGDNFHSYYNGHIGYEIFPKFRGNGYAFQAVMLVLDTAKKHSINKIYLTCKESNMASKRIFEKLGAEFIENTEIPKECFFYHDGIEKYSIYRLHF
ncbi:MAG: GNAT family N-acetyltransferase [Defluviitaleaceae bacterium]|nr:GNAT family N-acetyltransferase [Defluviitaleaceae bacterium]